MGVDTSIEWTDRTWNPTTGCTPVSPGCAHCYAKTMSKRLQAMAKADINAGKNPGKKRLYLDVINDRGNWSGKVNCDDSSLEIPLHWKEPSKIFVNSMSDLFWGTPADIEAAKKAGAKNPQPVPADFIDSVFAVMEACPQHTFQILTKRIERAAEYFKNPDRVKFISDACHVMQHAPDVDVDCSDSPEIEWPLPNVWIGTSVENQQCANERIPHLLRCSAARRFLSCEPLLGPVDIAASLASAAKNPIKAQWQTAWRGIIDWVIVGGESGHGARPFGIPWAESIIKQCKYGGAACFMKQLGARPFLVGDVAEETWDAWLKLKDGKGGDMSEWQAHLRVRQFPEVARAR